MARGRLPTRPVPYPEFDGTQPCVGVGPDGFHPNGADHKQTLAAKQVCAGCPFTDPCREFAISYDVLGVWGGTSYADRRRARRELGITAIPVTVNDYDLVRGLLAEVDDGVTNSEVIARQVGCSSKTVQRFRLERRVAA